MQKMKRLREQIAIAIVQKLKPLYPAKSALAYKTPFQFLVSVVLSAQCTDKKVNEVTIPIFKKYKTAKDFSKIPIRQLERMVKQTGFYKSKAAAISFTAKRVAIVYNNRVPLTMDELLTLRGVGRKSANVIMSDLTGKTDGIVVDTHVIRLSNRLGLTKNQDPTKIECDLMNIVPRKHWALFPHLLVYHGRSICIARRPKCDQCPLNQICPSAFNFPNFQK